MEQIPQKEKIARLLETSAKSAMILLSTGGQVLFAHHETERLLGYEKGELLNKPIGSIVSGSLGDIDAQSPGLLLDTKTGLQAHRQLQLIRKDRDVLNAEVSILQLATENGNLPLIMIHDLQEDESALQKIENNDARFKVFFDNAPEAIVVVDLSTLTFMKNNFNALKLFKFPSDDLKKVSLIEVSPKIQPDGKSSEEKLKNLMHEIIHTQRMFFEWMIRDSEGHDILCEMRVVVLPDLEERQLLISFVDIEERKRMENELRVDNKRLRFRLENALMGFVEWDNQLHLKTWSHQIQEIFGWTAAEVMEEKGSVLGLVHYDDLEWVKDVMQQLIDGKIERISVLQRNHTKNGRIIWCEWSHSVLKDEEGKVIATMAIVNDVTERKEAEDEIRKLNVHLEDRVYERTAELTQVNRELEGFSYSVSHDLRAPVRAIVSFVSLIKRQYGGTMDSDLMEMFEHIESNGKRMDTIIEDLLALAKYGKEKLRLTRVDMTRLFHDVWANISRTTPHATILELPPLPQVKGDASLLEQILVNLLSNAIKYSSKKKKPVVQVGFSQDEEKTTFFVRDNGAGFNMDYYSRLFGAFQRLHGMSEFEGTGVGLLLVKRLVEKHGGTVWAESKVDEGATFYFSLPKAMPESTNTHSGKPSKRQERHPRVAPDADHMGPKRGRRGG